MAGARARGGVLALVALVGVAVLTGCSSADRVPGEHSSSRAADPAPVPVPVPSAFSTAVPRTSATLPPVRPVVAPVRLRVEWAGTDVPVEPVGVDDTGALALPPDPSTAGWYRYGAAPGSPAGSTVIAAHVDAVGYGVGPFAHLLDVPVGTAVDVTDASGADTRYAVSSVQLLEKTGVPWSSVFDPVGQRRLVLVTCGGAFDATTHHYLSNLVITATPR